MEVGRDNKRWSLTNYMANAHVFLRGYANDDMGSRWGRATGRWTQADNTNRACEHENSSVVGVPPRQFAHVIDGLSNMIMFGEAMRRCDADPRSSTRGKFRYAFLPTATQPAGEEHTCGIDPAVSNTGAALTSAGCGGYGTGSGNTSPNLLADGIWDMLMVPNDPTGNVLANTGEVGKDK